MKSTAIFAILIKYADLNLYTDIFMVLGITYNVGLVFSNLKHQSGKVDLVVSEVGNGTLLDLSTVDCKVSNGHSSQVEEELLCGNLLKAQLNGDSSKVVFT